MHYKNQNQFKAMFKSMLFISSVCVLHLLILFPSSESIRRLGLRNIYRQNKSPFVLLYEHESFRGKEHLQFFNRECVTLAPEMSNWASSVDTHRSCVSLCKDTNCAGPCHKVFSNQGQSKLRLFGYNDNIQSLKSCY